MLLFSSVCWAGVASNPFLRPGSNRTPPKVVPAPPPPKPIPNPAFAKEVEFRGYFLLKGIPHFCIFNKKANFGEWIRLTEKTYEEFEAQSFDLDSETLTVAFNGQSFNLTLEQSKSSPTISPSPPGLPKVKLPSNTSVSGNPKVMPPRPKSAPKLPPWLANRMSSRATSQSSANLARPSSTRFAPPSRRPSTVSNQLANPVGVSPRSATNTLPSNISSTTSSTVSSDSPGSNISSTPVTSVSTNPSLSPSVTSDGNQIDNSLSSELAQDTNLNKDQQSELDDLPPPPPPPNILPPSPPPDIVPSMDE